MQGRYLIDSNLLTLCFRPAFYLYAALKIMSGLLILNINLEFKSPAQNVVADVLTVLRKIEIVALFITCFILGKFRPLESIFVKNSLPKGEKKCSFEVKENRTVLQYLLKKGSVITNVNPKYCAIFSLGTYYLFINWLLLPW